MGIDGALVEGYTGTVALPRDGQQGYYVRVTDREATETNPLNLEYIPPDEFGAVLTELVRRGLTVATETETDATIANGASAELALSLSAGYVYELSVRAITEDAVGDTFSFELLRYVVSCAADSAATELNETVLAESGTASFALAVAATTGLVTVTLTNSSGATRGYSIRIGIDAVHPIPEAP